MQDMRNGTSVIEFMNKEVRANRFEEEQGPRQLSKDQAKKYERI
jgi:hypothetical protein